MVSVVGLVILITNTVVFVYYGGKWAKMRSIQQKVTSCQIVSLTTESISEGTGKYVFVSGTVKALTKGIPSKYSGDLVTAVVQNIQRMQVYSLYHIKK